MSSTASRRTGTRTADLTTQEAPWLRHGSSPLILDFPLTGFRMIILPRETLGFKRKRPLPLCVAPICHLQGTRPARPIPELAFGACWTDAEDGSIAMAEVEVRHALSATILDDIQRLGVPPPLVQRR